MEDDPLLLECVELLQRTVDNIQPEERLSLHIENVIRLKGYVVIETVMTSIKNNLT